jgi:hypothetical protein
VRKGLADAPAGHDVPAQEDGQPLGLLVGGRGRSMNDMTVQAAYLASTWTPGEPVHSSRL